MINLDLLQHRLGIRNQLLHPHRLHPRNWSPHNKHNLPPHLSYNNFSSRYNHFYNNNRYNNFNNNSQTQKLEQVLQTGYSEKQTLMPQIIQATQPPQTQAAYLRSTSFLLQPPARRKRVRRKLRITRIYFGVRSKIKLPTRFTTNWQGKPLPWFFTCQAFWSTAFVSKILTFLQLRHQIFEASS